MLKDKFSKKSCAEAAGNEGKACGGFADMHTCRENALEGSQRSGSSSVLPVAKVGKVPAVSYLCDAGLCCIMSSKSLCLFDRRISVP